MRGKNGDNRAYHVVLDRKDVLKVSVVVLGPAVSPSGGFDQLGRYANAVAGTPHTALQHVSYAQFASDLAHVDRLALVLEAGIAGDNKYLREPRQLGNDVLDDAVDKIFLFQMRTQVVERQHGNRGLVRKRRCLCLCLLRFDPRRSVIQQDAVDMHRVVNILELVLTKVFEGDGEPAEAGLHILLHSARHTNTASVRQFLQSRCHVYAIAMDARAFYDIADVDPHSEFDPFTCRNPRISFGHCALDLDGTTQGIHGADEQHQQSVTSCPYDPTTVLFNFRCNELSMMSVQPSQGAFIIDAYQAAVSGNIRHQDCHESAFDFLTGHN